MFMHINEMVNSKIKQGSEYMPFLCYFKIYFLKYMYSFNNRLCKNTQSKHFKVVT